VSHAGLWVNQAQSETPVQSSDLQLVVEVDAQAARYRVGENPTFKIGRVRANSVC
jgi:hypothetical protein